MRRDNKPYSVRLLINAVRAFYTRWRIVPQFDSVGSGLEIVGGHRLEIYGPDIHLGENVHIQTARGQMSRHAHGRMAKAETAPSASATMCC